MLILHTTYYDKNLKAGLKHFQNYPQMLPFIGRLWKKSESKVLLLGESHYIPRNELSDIPNESHLKDWYHNNSTNFYPRLADCIDTRGVVDKADNLEIEGFARPLTMFYNIKSAIQNEIPTFQNEKYIFPFFSFYNYFQRPHFEVGGSINNHRVDDEVAYHTLKFITRLIQPKKIIFVSTKAKDSFNWQSSIDPEKLVLENILIDVVPHASSAWWNTKATAYGNQTGREKFISLIRK